MSNPQVPQSFADHAVDTVQARQISNLRRFLGEYLSVYNDPRLTEFVVNPDGTVWVEKLGEKIQKIGVMPTSATTSIIEVVAGFHRKVVTETTPILEAEFPLDGSRFEGLLPPVVNAPTFVIRKKAVAVFPLDQYVTDGIMTERQRKTIQQAITDHKSILVVGGTNSGKTTLVNAIINEMVDATPDDRIIIIEDTGEIQCKARNYTQLHSTWDVPMSTLLKATLRLRPNRIIVGEVRGAEALDLLMSWNTGHPGGTATIHANDAKSGLTRMVQCIGLGLGQNVHGVYEPLVAEAVDLVIFIAKSPEGRRVQEVLEVRGYENGEFITKPL